MHATFPPHLSRFPESASYLEPIHIENYFRFSAPTGIVDRRNNWGDDGSTVQPAKILGGQKGLRDDRTWAANISAGSSSPLRRPRASVNSSGSVRSLQSVIYNHSSYPLATPFHLSVPQKSREQHRAESGTSERGATIPRYRAPWPTSALSLASGAGASFSPKARAPVPVQAPSAPRNGSHQVTNHVSRPREKKRPPFNARHLDEQDSFLPLRDFRTVSDDACVSREERPFTFAAVKPAGVAGKRASRGRRLPPSETEKLIEAEYRAVEAETALAQTKRQNAVLQKEMTTKMENLDAKFRQLEKERDFIKRQNADMLRQKLQLTNQLKAVEAQLELQAFAQVSVEQLKAVQKSLDEITQVADQRQEQLAELEKLRNAEQSQWAAQLKRMERQADNGKAQLEVLQQKLEKDRELLQQREKLLQEQKSDALLEAQRAREEASRRVQKLETDKQEAEQKHQSLVLQLEDKRHTLEMSLQRVTQEREQAKKGYQDKVNELAALKNELDRQASAHQCTEAQLETSRAEAKRVSELLADVASLHSQLEQEENQYKADRATWERQRLLLESEQKALEERLRGTTSTLEQKLDAYRVSQEKTEQLLKAEQQQRADTEKRNVELLKKVEQLTLQCTQLQEASDSRHVQDDAEERHAAMKQTVAELRSELEEVTSTRETSIASYAQQLTEKNLRIEQLEEELKSIHLQYSSRDKTAAAQLEEATKTHQALLDERERVIQQLQDQYNSAQTEVISLQEAVTAAETAMETLKNDKKETENAKLCQAENELQRCRNTVELYTQLQNIWNTIDNASAKDLPPEELYVLPKEWYNSSESEGPIALHEHFERLQKERLTLLDRLKRYEEQAVEKDTKKQDELQNQVSEQQEHLETLRQRLDDMTVVHERMLAQKTDIIEELQRTIDQLTAENATLITQLAATTTQPSTPRTQSPSNHTDHYDVNEKLQEMEKSLGERHKLAIEELTDRLRSIETERDSAVCRVKEMEEQLQQWSDKDDAIKMLRAQQEQEAMEAAEKIKKLEEQVAVLQKPLESVEDYSCDVLQKSIDLLQTENTSLKAKIEELQQRSIEEDPQQKQKQQHLELELDNLRKQLDSEQQAQHSLMAEKLTLSATLATVQQENTKLTEELSVLNDKLATAHAENTSKVKKRKDVGAKKVKPKQRESDDSSLRLRTSVTDQEETDGQRDSGDESKTTRPENETSEQEVLQKPRSLSPTDSDTDKTSTTTVKQRDERPSILAAFTGGGGEGFLATLGFTTGEAPPSGHDNEPVEPLTPAAETGEENAAGAATPLGLLTGWGFGIPGTTQEAVTETVSPESAATQDETAPTNGTGQTTSEPPLINSPGDQTVSEGTPTEDTAASPMGTAGATIFGTASPETWFSGWNWPA